MLLSGLADQWISSVLTNNQEQRMRVTQIIADLHVPDLPAAKGFYTDYLGLTDEEFNLGWVARYTSPETGVDLQVMTRDATAPEDPVISVKVDDVEAAYRQRRSAATRSCIR